MLSQLTQNNPQILDMLSDPSTLQMMSDPAFMQNAMSMLQGGGGNY